jgi:putative tricarboxylic transport membrane protein
VSAETALTPGRRLQAALPYLVVLAVGIFLYVAADRFEFEQMSGRIGPGAWPKLILTLMMIAALWGVGSSALWGAKFAASQDPELEEAEDLARPPEIHPFRVWIAVAITLGYLVLLPQLGFFLTTIGYSAALMVLGEFRRPLPVALLSVAIGLFFMFAFMRVVYVALPVGVAPFSAVSYALMAAMGVH